MSNKVEVLAPMTEVFVVPQSGQGEVCRTVVRTKIHYAVVRDDGVAYHVFGVASVGVAPHRVFLTAEEAFAAELK